MGARPEGLCELIAERMVARLAATEEGLAEFDAMSVSSVVWSFATMGEKSTCSRQEVRGHQSAYRSPFGPAEKSLGRNGTILLLVLGMELEEHMHDAEPQVRQAAEATSQRYPQNG